MRSLQHITEPQQSKGGTKFFPVKKGLKKKKRREQIISFPQNISGIFQAQPCHTAPHLSPSPTTSAARKPPGGGHTAALNPKLQLKSLISEGAQCSVALLPATHFVTHTDFLIFDAL